ncbi:hypothetical protein HK096_006159, partial [Nowakowskiella sp. JEL0078]
MNAILLRKHFVLQLKPRMASKHRSRLTLRLGLYQVILALLRALLISAQNCTLYSPGTASNVSGICQGVLNYPIYIPANVSISLLERSLVNLTDLVSLKSTFPNCANAFAEWACAVTFPRCDATNINFIVQPPCQSLCNNALNECQKPFSLISKQSSLPDCKFLSRFNSTYPTSNCVDKSMVGNWTFGSTTNASVPTSSIFANGCPLPFVLSSSSELANMDVDTKSRCLGPCCIPCPIVDAFYSPSTMDLANRITTILRIVSTGFSFIVLISYLILPGYQTRPRDLILYVSGSLFLWQGSVLFSAPNTHQIQCKDRFTSSTQQNNIICAVQGGVLMFGLYALILWASCLIMNLHLHLVWKIKLIDRYIWVFHILCFTIPAVMSAVPLALGYIKYEFGTVCFVTQKYSNAYFFYPLAALIYPVFLIHCITFAVILKTTINASSEGETPFASQNGTIRSANSRVALSMSGKSQIFQKSKAVQNSFKMQWRPMVLAFLILFCILALNKLLAINPQDSDWVQQWISCLFTTQTSNAAAQKNGAITIKTPFDACYNFVEKQVPNFAVNVLVDVIVSTPGIWLFVIFGLRSELFHDWSSFIRGGCCGRRRNREKEAAIYEIQAYALTEQSISIVPPVPPLPEIMKRAESREETWASVTPV